MQYKVNGKSVTLNRNEVTSAKRYLSQLFQKVKNLAEKKHQPTYFFTFLIVAHMLSQEALDNMDPKTLSMIMNRLNGYREKENQPD